MDRAVTHFKRAIALDPGYAAAWSGLAECYAILPISADRALAARLFDDIAAQDPNCLAPTAFVVGDGRLTLEPLGESYGAA